MLIKWTFCVTNRGILIDLSVLKLCFGFKYWILLNMFLFFIVVS